MRRINLVAETRLLEGVARTLPIAKTQKPQDKVLRLSFWRPLRGRRKSAVAGNIRDDQSWES
jgi:hypothetical protein